MTENPSVFFDITIGGQPVGRIVFEIFENIVPLTARNFIELAQATEPGQGYIGSKFHRIIPAFMLQGGDFTRGNGTVGRSIYGEKFADENFMLTHDEPFLLSMANAGPNTNGSQFFITTIPCPWLDGKHVVFGKVTEGQDVVKAVEAIGTRSGMPTQVVAISACGTVGA